MLTLVIVWFSIALVMVIGFAFFGSLFTIWLAGALVLITVLPVPLPDYSNLHELAIWAVAGLAYLMLWLVLLRPRRGSHSADQLTRQLLVGEKGLLVEGVGGAEGQRVQFAYPIQGVFEWPVFPSNELSAGDEVEVVDLIGKLLVVRKTVSPVTGSQPAGRTPPGEARSFKKTGS